MFISKVVYSLSMVGFRRRHALIVVVLVAIFLGGLLALTYGYTIIGVGLAPQGGLCFVSERQSSEGNVSYTTSFHNVSFTFNYWTYPVMYDENGTSYYVTDMPYRAYFTVRFSDGAIENLSIAVGGYTGVFPLAPLRTAMTTHASPQAGIGTAFTYELHGHWVFLVSVA